MKFDVRYYLVAILFILFDLEIAFLFPWAVSLREIGPTGFWAMMIFLGILVVGFAYDLEEREPSTGNDMSLDGVLKEGFVTTSLDTVINWSEDGLVVADDVRSRVLRRGDDACRRVRATTWTASAMVFRPSPRQSRRDDRRRHAVQQDGARAAQGLRPDDGAALGHLHGLVRQRRWVLPLLAIRSYAAATASSRWTSTCRAARRRPRR